MKNTALIFTALILIVATETQAREIKECKISAKETQDSMKFSRDEKKLFDLKVKNCTDFNAVQKEAFSILEGPVSNPTLAGKMTTLSLQFETTQSECKTPAPGDADQTDYLARPSCTNAINKLKTATTPFRGASSTAVSSPSGKRPVSSFPKG